MKRQMLNLFAAFTALTAAFSSLPAYAAPQCNIHPAGRADRVADYVDAARVCLNAPPIGFEFDAGHEADFLRLINAERTKRGIAPLRLRTEAIESARFHSLDMAANNFFGHSGPDHRLVWNRIAAFDRRAVIEGSSENVAMLEIVRGRYNLDRDAVPKLHRNLMDSESHRKNILHLGLTDVSIGVTVTATGVWVTQVFMDLSGTLTEPLPLRLSAGERVTAVPMLKKWTFRNYEAERADTVYVPFTPSGALPPEVYGDSRLALYAERAGAVPNLRHSIRLEGPAFSVQ